MGNEEITTVSPSISEKLFSNIAQRLYSENILSDITWAFMMSCEQFKKDFIKFCFRKEISGSCDLKREYQDGHSRPDFHFYDSNQNEYLLEVKIYDRNQHFSQYNRDFPNATKAFISNYELRENEKSGIQDWKALVTWKKLYETIEKNVKSYIGEEKQLINSYLAYLEHTIGYRRIKKMDFSNIKSLVDFYDSITEIGNENGFSTYDRLASAISKNRYGRYFYKEDNEHVAYFWFGLWIADENNPSERGIWISFDNFKDTSWLSATYRSNLNNMKENGKHYTEKKIDNGDMWFKLNDTEFNNNFIDSTASTSEQQKQILKDFFHEVIDEVIK